MSDFVRIKDFKIGKKKEIFALFKKLRSAVLNEPGYISGETLIDHDDPRITLVIGTWQSMDDWLAWKEDPRRKELETRLEPLLEGPTEYEAFVYSKYYLSVSGESS